MKAKCIVFPQALHAELGEVDVRAPGAGELLTQTRMTGVSTGTETRVFLGKQDGAVFPLIPGYENLGEVIEARPGTSVRLGQRIFVHNHLYDPAPFTRCWGGQVSHSLTNEQGVVPIPDAVVDEQAIFAKVSAISLHGVKRARVRSEEWVVVVGLGLIGHLVVQHCVARGARVIAVDMEEDRRVLAKAAGAVATIDAAEAHAVEEARELTGGGANVAFDATGIASVLQPTSLFLRARAWDEDPGAAGRLVLQGTVEEPLSLDYMALFRREIDLITPRDADTQDLLDSLELMERGRIRPELIPSERVSFRSCDTTYPRRVNREIMLCSLLGGSR